MGPRSRKSGAQHGHGKNKPAKRFDKSGNAIEESKNVPTTTRSTTRSTK